MKFSGKIERCGLSPMRKFAPYAAKAENRHPGPAEAVHGFVPQQAPGSFKRIRHCAFPPKLFYPLTGYLFWAKISRGRTCGIRGAYDTMRPKTSRSTDKDSKGG